MKYQQDVYQVEPRGILIEFKKLHVPEKPLASLYSEII
jgi:hypothetical protein